MIITQRVKRAAEQPLSVELESKRIMVEFATPSLGEDNPAIQTAKQQLQERKYLESLVTMREALKAIR